MNKLHSAVAGLARMPKSTFSLLTIFFLFTIADATAQFVSNGNFNASGTDWNDCGNNTEAYTFETTYGGPNGSNHVAEIDGNGTNKNADNMTLCQDMTGFTVGQSYQLSFMASRRATPGTPSTVSVTVTINGGALTQTVSRNNTTFGWTSENFTFTATQTSHRLTITPNFTSSLGFIIDDISIQAMGLGMPVELSSFEAKSLGCEVSLDWTVASAENFSHFELEKSFDGRNFVKLDEQAIKDETDPDYHFTDRNPGQANYYRLKQVDLDGSYAYSKTISASAEGCGDAVSSFLVYPNPVRQGQSLFVDFAAQSGSNPLFVFNAYGQTVQQVNSPEEGQSTLEVDMSRLVPGIYFIGNGRGKAVRFVVE